MLKFSEFFEFFREIKNRNFQNFERILTELRSEKFEWVGPSPIEPFNLGAHRAHRARRARRALRALRRGAPRRASGRGNRPVRALEFVIIQSTCASTMLW